MKFYCDVLYFVEVVYWSFDQFQRMDFFFFFFEIWKEELVIEVFT